MSLFMTSGHPGLLEDQSQTEKKFPRPAAENLHAEEWRVQWCCAQSCMTWPCTTDGLPTTNSPTNMWKWQNFIHYDNPRLCNIWWTATTTHNGVSTNWLFVFLNLAYQLLVIRRFFNCLLQLLPSPVWFTSPLSLSQPQPPSRNCGCSVETDLKAFGARCSFRWICFIDLTTVPLFQGI